MKRTFCILAIVFGVLCLLCGFLYGCICLMDVLKKIKNAKETALQKLRNVILEVHSEE